MNKKGEMKMKNKVVGVCLVLLSVGLLIVNYSQGSLSKRLDEIPRRYEIEQVVEDCKELFAGDMFSERDRSMMIVECIELRFERLSND